MCGIERESPNQEVSMAQASSHKVAIIEDEGLIAADLKRRLLSVGYDVTGIADTGSSALQLIQDTCPDVVLMDIRIKGQMDGIQVASQVREKLDVPVVFLTAYEDREILDRAAQTQAFGYIKKPIASASLQGSIEMAISKHRHERELRAARDWAAASFASVPSAVVVTDGSGKIQYLNSMAEQLTGRSSNDVEGRSSRELLRLIYRDSGRPLEDFVPVAMLQGETISFPSGVCLLGGGGRTYTIDGSVAPRWCEGRVEGTVIAFTDTTFGKFEEEQSLQDHKQQALLRLADGLAKQLPDPAVLAEDRARLLEALPPDSPHRPDAESIGRAAMDAIAVTYRLRSYLQLPDMHLRRVAVGDLLASLEAAWNKFHPMLRLVPEVEPAMVHADEWQLTKALVSILLHARAHMTHSDGLVIDAAGADIDRMSHSVRIRISYPSADENAESIERIFEPSLSSDTDDLPLAYRLIKRMGGLVSARMEPGQKAVCDIYLSRVNAAGAGVKLPSPEPVVLLIEPNPEVRRVLHLHLERHGYNLLATGDSGEALLLAQLYRGAIPLIIANPDGYASARAELAEKLVSVRPRSRVRVLDGYYECRRAAAGDSLEWTESRHLTKWDLLAWVNDAFASVETNVFES
jgi:CheY-like chemotaxis protein